MSDAAAVVNEPVAVAESDPITSAIETAVATLPTDETPAAEPAETLEPEAGTDAPNAGTPEAKPEAKPAEDDEEKALSEIEKELLEKTPGLGKGKMAVSRHQAVLTRTRRALEAQIEEVKKASAQYEAPEFKERLTAVELAEKNPQAFVDYVLAHPTYTPLVEKILADRMAKAAPAAPAAAAPGVEETRPEPDVLNADGTLGYSAEAARRLAAYEAGQVRAALTKEFGAKLGDFEKTLNPIREERESQARYQQAVQRATERLEHARKNLEGFQENEAEIMQLMKQPGNERMTEFEAYARVVTPKHKADRAKLEQEIREAVLADIRKAGEATPARTPVSPAPGAGTNDNPDVDPVEAAIRSSIRGLK